MAYNLRPIDMIPEESFTGTYVFYRRLDGTPGVHLVELSRYTHDQFINNLGRLVREAPHAMNGNGNITGPEAENLGGGIVRLPPRPNENNSVDLQVTWSARRDDSGTSPSCPSSCCPHLKDGAFQLYQKFLMVVSDIDTTSTLSLN